MEAQEPRASCKKCSATASSASSGHEKYLVHHKLTRKARPPKLEHWGIWLLTLTHLEQRAHAATSPNGGKWSML
eukprot:3330540-Amphidinium_carterae.1